jgi:hypothetical protein
MGTRRWLLAGPLAAMAVTMVGAQLAHAEPLTPPTPAEIQYLEQIRRVFAVSHDPVAFRSDGELLADGRYVCERRDYDFVGQATNLVSPVITQLAFIYLCPK